jgi:hypothetical protein
VVTNLFACLREGCAIGRIVILRLSTPCIEELLHLRKHQAAAYRQELLSRSIDYTYTSASHRTSPPFTLPSAMSPIGTDPSPTTGRSGPATLVHVPCMAERCSKEPYSYGNYGDGNGGEVWEESTRAILWLETPEHDTGGNRKKKRSQTAPSTRRSPKALASSCTTNMYMLYYRRYEGIPPRGRGVVICASQS